MAASKRLKVFQAQFGFYDTVVAAPSQASALRAWGTHQDLFESGQAQITDDPQAIAAATKHPETPLRRPIGSTDPFTLDPTGKPVIPDEPKPRADKGRHAKVSKAEAPAPTKPVDRSALDAAEVALRKLEDARKKEEARLRQRRDALEAEEQAAQEAYVGARKKAASVLSKAQDDYRSAGGHSS